MHPRAVLTKYRKALVSTNQKNLTSKHKPTINGTFNGPKNAPLISHNISKLEMYYHLKFIR